MNIQQQHSPARAAAYAPVQSLEKLRLRAYLVLVLADVFAILLAYAAAGWAYHGRFPDPKAMQQAQVLLPLYLTVAIYSSVYSTDALARFRLAVFRMVAALVIAAALINLIGFLLRTNSFFSRVVFVLGMSMAALAMAAVRAAMCRFVRQSWGPTARNELVIDDGGPEFVLPHATRLDARANDISPAVDDPVSLDRVGRFLLNQDKVVVSCPVERRAAWAFVLKAAGVHGEIISEPAHRLGAVGLHVYEAEGRTALVVAAKPLGLRARVTKRLLDIALAAGGLLVLSPVLLLCAIAIKLEDGGPLLFVQRRLGRGNQFFRMLKFRSMRVSGEDEDGVRSTARHDDRVTRTGNFLRRTSLDEVPQLWNVLRGDMSIVGPRPHAIGSQAGTKLFWEVDANYWRRHSLKPGLTGLAQIRGLRGATHREEDLADRLQSDLEYIADWSPWRDLRIIFATLRVLRHQNAY